MKTLELNQMEGINAGSNSCSWGLWAVGIFWGVAISVGTAGAGTGVGIAVSAGFKLLADEVC